VNWRKDSLGGIARTIQLTQGKLTLILEYVLLAQFKHRNFTKARKWCIIGFIGGITFLSTLSSSMFAPGISFVNEDLNNTSQILGSWSISIFLLGYSVIIFPLPNPEIYINHRPDRPPLPQPIERDLWPPHYPQSLQNLLLCIQLGQCSRT
jgi:hypothetical protein